jgi:hypothetical protein
MCQPKLTLARCLFTQAGNSGSTPRSVLKQGFPDGFQDQTKLRNGMVEHDVSFL